MRKKEEKKLATRKNDFNLMFNGFLFIFLIRQPSFEHFPFSFKFSASIFTWFFPFSLVNF